jgi:hypothetical protein
VVAVSLDVGEEAQLATTHSHPWWYNSRRN